MSPSESLFEEHLRKQAKKQIEKREKSRPVFPADSFEDTDNDIPLIQLCCCKKRTLSVPVVPANSSVEVHPNRLLELARQTRLTQSG